MVSDFYVALHDCITKDADFYSRGQSTFKKSKKGSRCYYGGDFRLIKLGNLYLVQQASLGYYINPLLNVLAGALYLKEPLTKQAKLASLSALTGVILLTLQTGVFPFNSLFLATSFCLYGLTKKQLQLSSATSITLETLIIAPIGQIYLFFISPTGFMNYSMSTNVLLMGAGVVTAIPLLLFATAVKKLSYITLGFLQYVNPTIMLVMAIFLFHEPYALPQFIAFAFIWLGILIFVAGNLIQVRKKGLRP